MFLDPPQGSSILARAGQQCQPRIQEGLPSNKVSLFYILAPKKGEASKIDCLTSQSVGSSMEGQIPATKMS